MPIGNSPVPLPEQTPIQKAGWDTSFNGNVQLPNNDRTPVNPINAMLGQQAQQSQIGLQGAQTAAQLSEVQQKQRQMQASLLGALAKASPEQFEAAKSIFIPMINRSNPSYQIDPNIDQQTAGMIAMGAVPVEQQPTYALNQQLPQVMQQVRGRITQGGDGQGQPSVPGQIIDPKTLGLMATIPAMDKAVDTINNTQRTAYDSPDVKADTDLKKHTADNLADAQKTFNTASAALPRALERFQKVRDAADDASYGLGSDEAGNGYGPDFARSGLGALIEPKTAGANQTIRQAVNQGVLNELGPQLQGMKGNKFLEGIASEASGLHLADPPEVKKQAIDGLQDQYIAGLKAVAQQRRDYGDKTAPSDADIDKMVAQAMPKRGAAPKLGTIEQGHIYQGGDPSNPASWKAIK